MNLSKMIAELRTQRESIEQAILVLERTAAGQSRRRGTGRDSWIDPRAHGKAVKDVKSLLEIQ
jgi:hypothetical protein